MRPYIASFLTIIENIVVVIIKILVQKIIYSNHFQSGLLFTLFERINFTLITSL